MSSPPYLCHKVSQESRREPEANPCSQGLCSSTKVELKVIIIQTKLDIHIRSEQKVEGGANVRCSSRDRLYGGNQGLGVGRLNVNQNRPFPLLTFIFLPRLATTLRSRTAEKIPGSGVSLNPNLMLPFYFWRDLRTVTQIPTASIFFSLKWGQLYPLF